MASTTFMALTNSLLARLNEVTIAQSDFSSVRGVQKMAKEAVVSSIFETEQTEFEWPFNAAIGTQVLTAGTEEYSWPADMKVPKWDSFRILKDASLSTNGHYLRPISRDEWIRRSYSDDQYSEATGVSIPVYAFEKHGFGFGVTPSPDKAYTVEFEYFILNAALVAYDDTSTIPSIYDEVIIQGALYHFYMFRDNLEMARVTQETYAKRLNLMRTLLINKESTMRSHLVVGRNRTLTKTDTIG